ncbi:MAG: hypothetical protein ACUVTN_01660 [Thermodesulfobacteriota bacterium]
MFLEKEKAKVRSFPLFMTVSQVTQTAEVEVKRASINRRGSLETEKGLLNKRLPIKMVKMKLSTKILEGDRTFHKKVLI